MSANIPGIAPAVAGLGSTTSSSSFSGMGSTGAAGTAGKSDFMNTLQTAMDQVGALQSEADGKVSQLLTGNGHDVHSAMIAIEKATLAFQMMLQVRNKIVAAYQQVSGIQF
jgi:flagellar hook-basal body complex protein FliE